MDGKNVLVVCHSYVLMAMAIYLAGRTRNDFIFFKVPNGKALTTEELVALLGKETDTFDAGLKYLGDMTNIYALRSTVVMFLVGAIVRIAAGNGLPDILFKVRCLKNLLSRHPLIAFRVHRLLLYSCLACRRSTHISMLISLRRQQRRDDRSWLSSVSSTRLGG